MLRIESIKPIPKYIVEKIRKMDNKMSEQNAYTRFYAYLTMLNKVLVKVTVAVKTYKKKWYCKQVAIHGMHERDCLAKDIYRSFLSGYLADWYEELGVNHYYNIHAWTYEPDKYWDPWAPIVNVNYLKRFPQYKYSGYERLNDCKMLQFLMRYEEYPQIEYLMKMGLTDLWKSTRICKLLAKDKAFCRWMVRNQKELEMQWYNKTTIINSYKRGRSLEEQAEIEYRLGKIRSRDYKGICKAFRGETNQLRLLRYLEETKVGIGSYWDYYQACVELGIDMNDTKNRYPRDFTFWHDTRIEQRKAKRIEMDAEKRREFYAMFASTIAKYLPLEQTQTQYAVIIAHTPGELIAEGNALNHCVGKMGYDKKVVEGKSLIFFVRKADRIDEPFVTMEYSLSTHKVLQLYGKGNTAPTTEVQDYIYKKWLPRANRELKRIAA